MPPPRSLTAAAPLQRCYAAATGCSNAPAPSPIRGLLGPGVLVRSLCTTAHWQHVRMLQSLQECPSPVTNQGTIGACSPCVAAWLLQHLCSAVMLQPLAAVMPQSRYQSRGYWGLQSCAAACAPQPIGSTFACCSHCWCAPVPLPIKGLLEPAVWPVRCALHRASCCLSCRSACTCVSRRVPRAPRGVLVVGPVVCVSREDHPPRLTQAGSALDRPAPHDD